MITLPEEDMRKLRTRFEGMNRMREDFVEQYEDLRDYILPHSSMGLSSGTSGKDRREPDDGSPRYGKILNTRVTQAATLFGGGLYSGMMSPSFPWFRLSVKGMSRKDQDKTAVKRYLDDVETAIRDAFERWGFYGAAQHVCLELGVFGTSVVGFFEDPETEARIEPYTVGEYWLAQSSSGEVNSCCLRRVLTVGQLVEEYGIDNVSDSTKRLYEKDNLEERVEVFWLVEPNDDRISVNLKPTRPEFVVIPPAEGEEMDEGNASPPPVERADVEYAFRGITWEGDQQELRRGKIKVLRITGYEEFPVLAPRWTLYGNAVYGRSQGMIALNDSRVLQALRKKMLVALDKQLDPPLQIDASLAGQTINSNPGGHNYVDGVMSGRAGGAVQGLYQVDVNWQIAKMEQEEAVRNFEQAFFLDLFLMIASQPGNSRMTATEVLARQQEKVQLLGPNMERVDKEFLEKAIKRAFSILDRAGRLPEMPDELEGRELDIVYRSVLAQALQSTRLVGVNQFIAWVTSIGAVQPEVLDKVNWSETADFIADTAGVPPGLLLSDQEFSALQKARAQALQREQELQNQNVEANTALSAAKAQGEQNTMAAETMSMQTGGVL